MDSIVVEEMTLNPDLLVPITREDSSADEILIYNVYSAFSFKFTDSNYFDTNKVHDVLYSVDRPCGDLVFSTNTYKPV